MFTFFIFYFTIIFVSLEVCAFSAFPSNLNLCTEPLCGTVGRSKGTRTVLSSNKHEEDSKPPDPLTKSSWYIVEAFGNMFGGTGGSKPSVIAETDQPPKSISQTKERLRMDNERSYFLSGTVDELIYSESCVFADPFVSFSGRDRFVKNLANLGSFITDYSTKPLNYSENDNVVETKFMVKLRLNLPWKPVLAWPWGVRCEIDPETYLIVQHQESVRNPCLHFDSLHTVV
jgi:Uncharacterized conserved protein (DUF2358)